MKVDKFSEEELLKMEANSVIDMNKPVEFYIVECLESMTKSSEPCLRMKLDIYQNERKFFSIYEIVVFSKVHAFLARRARDFCFSINCAEQYSEGEINAYEFLNKKGKAYIEAKEYEKNGEKKTGSAIKLYLPFDDNNKKDDFNDDIDF